jgi:DNA-binding HxlR family transcriptional regulator
MNDCQSIESRPGCLKSALAVLGEKWTALLLSSLSEGTRTFSELEELVVGINPRTLSQRLDKLAAEKIIVKQLYNDHPPRYRYELTKKGTELQDVLRAMADWGDKYHLA